MTKTKAYEEHNCILVMELQDGTEIHFRCWVPTDEVDFPSDSDDGTEYEAFWDHHHPWLGWYGTDAGLKIFWKYYDSKHFASIYYTGWQKNQVDTHQKDAIL